MSKIGQVAESWLAEQKAIIVDNLMPGLVPINQHRTLAANNEFLQASDYTMTEARG